MEKRILSKTAPQHGGRVARNVCFPIGKLKLCDCSCRCFTPSCGGLSMYRRAWPGNVVFPCGKVSCAPNWLSTRKFAKPKRRSARRGANLPNQKCCFPNGKRLVFNIGAPALVHDESQLPFAEKVACSHSGTGSAKAGFSEMTVFQLGK